MQTKLSTKATGGFRNREKLAWRLLWAALACQLLLLPNAIHWGVNTLQWGPSALLLTLLAYWAGRNPGVLGEAAAHVAGVDPLTDTATFRTFSQLLTQRLKQRDGRSRSAILVIDLDRFNVINNTVGSAVGDLLLALVAQRIKALLKPHAGSSLARRSGDEFIALLPLEPNQNSDDFTKKVAESFGAPFVVGGQEIFLSASIGVAAAPEDGNDAETLVRNAELAMCTMKQHGRNGFEHYLPAMSGAIEERHHLCNGLRRALENNELLLHYQPKVDVRRGRITGAEALLRWQHPARGLLGPDHFIAAAEDSGLIIPMGEWILKAACAQNKAWQKEGLSPIRIAVNISPVQFLQPNLVEMVQKVLKETGLEARYLEIEVTESIMFQDFARTAQALEELVAMGIEISIDDFGTGYSSFASLRRLPFHALKIDKSFVRDIVSNKGDAAIATTIIAMAGTLKLDVTAEGVETQSQCDFLKQNNCVLMQGYLFGKPMPSHEFAALLDGPATTESLVSRSFDAAAAEESAGR